MTTSPTAGYFRQAQSLAQAGQWNSAMSLYEKILAIDENHVDAMHYLGLAYLEQGQYGDARKWVEKSVNHRLGDAMYRSNYGVLLEETGDIEEAELQFRKGLMIDPHHADSRYNLGRLLVHQQRLHEAIDQLRRLDSQLKQDVEVICYLANAHGMAGQWPQALSHYRRALKIKPDAIKSRIDYARALAACGKQQQADEEFDDILKAEPNNVDVMVKRAEVAEKNNKLDVASKWLGRASQILPAQDPAVLMRQADIFMRKNDLKKAEAVLQSIDHGQLSLTAEIDYWFRFGHILDKQKRYGEAFKAYQAGNELRSKDKNYYSSKEELIRFAGQMRTQYARDQVMRLLEQARLPDGAQSEPVFIIGFPRSGTTLVEQILASHPEVCAGDELSAIMALDSDIRNRARHGEQEMDVAGFRQFYFDNIDGLGFMEKTATWFTDKMPFNALRLGLIKLAFPKSPVIHIIRHPLDVCLSCYFTDFAVQHGYSYKFSTLGFYFRNMIELVDYYRSQMDLNYMPVNYETLVTDAEPTVRKMLEFVGLPWDERCLEFHKNKRVARTASYAQVNQKLYTSSLHRYKHYREYIQPLIDELGPTIEKLGYDID